MDVQLKLPQPTLTPAFPTPSLATLPLFTPDLLAHLGTLHALSHLTAFTLFLFLCWKSRRRSSKPLQPLPRCQALSKRFTCINSFNPLHNPMDINRYFFFFFLAALGPPCRVAASLAVAHWLSSCGLVAPQQVGSYFPLQGLNQSPLHGKADS